MCFGLDIAHHQAKKYTVIKRQLIPRPKHEAFK
jgi:hypothetical protein